MSNHKAVLSSDRRVFRIGAAVTVLLLLLVALTQALGLSPARAATALLCDQNTVYGIESQGNAGVVDAINVTTGDTTPIPSLGAANNALGITPNGLQAYALVNSGTATTNGTIYDYDTTSGSVNQITGVTIPANTYRGAVNPVTKIYYYAEGNTTSAGIYGYNTVTGAKLGLVGHINGLTAANGDMAFSTSGQLFVASGAEVLRVDQTIPTVSGDAPLTSTLIANLPAGTNTPGVAFSTSGYLYVSNVTDLYKINPSSGALVSTTVMANNFYPVDLASCNYPNTLTGQSSVDTRWQAGDQFTTTVTGNGITAGNTATSTGSATGLQTAKSGANLTVPGTTYTVTQTGSGTTSLANYSTTYACTNTDTGQGVVNGTGNVASFTLPQPTVDGIDVNCVFTNTLIALHAKAVDDSYSTPKNTALTVAAPGILANDTGTGITYTSNTQPAHGTVTVSSSGGFTYTPDTGFAGTDTFPYTITDSAGVTSTATVSIVVGPIATTDTGTVVDGSTLTTTTGNGNVLDNDQGVGLTASNASTPAHGSVTLNANGNYTYTPVTPYSGPDSFTYQVTDSSGHSDTGTVDITVLPKAVSDTLAATTPGTTTTISTTPSLSNDIGTGLSVTAVGTPVHGTVSLNSGKTAFVYVANASYSGPDSFTYTVTDPSGGTSTAREFIGVTPVAVADTVPAIPAATADTLSSASLLANDKGTGLTVTGVSSASVGTVTLSSDHSTITFTPPAGFSGNATFVYTATDSSNQTTSATVTVPVAPGAVDDTGTAISGQTLVVAAPGVLGNDTGTGLTAAVASAPKHGALTLHADGSYTYAPSATFSGVDSFTYTATDSAGRSTTATDTITVLPLAVADALPNTPAGSPETVPAATILGNDDGAGLSITGVGTPAHGTAVLNADGSVTYTPAAGWSGPDSFSYTITDGSHTSSANDTVTTTPVAVDDTLPSTPVNTAKTYPASTFTANDHATGPTITAVGSAAHGTATLASNGGSVTYTPATGYSGPDSFTYTITDASGQTSTATASVSVTPIAGDLTTTATAGQADRVSADEGLLSQATGTNLTASVTAEPAHGTVTLGTGGAYTYTPAADFSGADSFTYTVTDGSGQTASGTVTVTVLPKANDDMLGAVAPGSSTTFQASAFLSNDDGAGLTVTAVTQPAIGSVVLNADGSVTFTAGSTASGDGSFTYTITDAAGRTSTATASVTISDVATPDADTTPAGSTLTVAAPGVLGNDTGTGLTATLAQAPMHGTVQLASDGSYVYVPKAGFSGVDTFTYTATDAHGNTATGVVKITVTPTPVADAYTATAGATKTVVAPGVLGDDLGTALTVSGVGAGATTGAAGTAVATTAGGSATLGANGSVSYTPPTGFSGTDTVNYSVTDGNGIASATSATVTFTVTPVAVDDTLADVTAGSSETVPGSTLTGNDKGSGLTVTAVGTPLHGAATLAGDGSVTYTPAAGYSGPDTFSYTVTDASGQTAKATVSVDVDPFAGDLTTTTVAGVPDRVGAADGLLSQSSGTNLTPAITTRPQHGTVALQGTTGAYTYTPAAGFSGTDSFGFSVTDPSGNQTTGVVQVTVTPKANADTVAAKAGTPIVVSQSALLANDLGTGLSVTSVTQPTNGTTTLAADGSVTYTPAPGTSGPDSFTYTVTDQAGNTSTATVAVGVADVATADTASTPAGSTLTRSAASGVLANDSGTALKASLVSGPSHGKLVLNADGSYTYTPAAGYSGPDSFVYTATDASGDTSNATVKLTVTPVAQDVTVPVVAGTPVHQDVPGVLAGDDGSKIVVTAVGIGAPGTDVTTTQGGTVDIAADGTLDYTPPAGFSGTDTVTYTVTDASGATATGTISFAVAPKAVDDSFTTPSGTPLPLTEAQLTANDLGSSLGVVSTTQPANGTLTQNGAGFVYTPAAGFSGTDSFSYTARDSSGGTTSATVRILVGDLAPDHAYTAAAGRPASIPAATGLLSGAQGTGVTASADAPPSHGTVTVAPDGSFVYTPAPGYSGPDSFTYTITDASGNTSTGTVTLTVTPVVGDDAVTTTAGTPIGIAAPGVLANDTGTGLVVTAVGTPKHGTATISGGGALVYTPAAGFSGTDSFPYTVTDDSGQTATGTVTVRVEPIAVPYKETTPSGGTLTVPASKGLLSGDTGTGLTAALTTAPQHGTVTVAPDGSYVYTAAAGFSGTDSFTYTVTDASGLTATNTVTITVPRGAVAVADPDSGSGTVGRPVTIDPLANDHPSSGATFVASSLTLIDPATGAHVATVTIPGEGTFRIVDGRVVFTPVEGFTGKATVRYQVTDTDGVTVTSSISVGYQAAAPAVPAASGSTPLTGTLAFTGSERIGGALLLAFLAIGAGIGMRLRGRRKKQA